VTADGTWDSTADEIGTAWWDGRQQVMFRRNKTDTTLRIGTFVDGYLKIEYPGTDTYWLFEKDGYTNYPSTHHPDFEG